MVHYVCLLAANFDSLVLGHQTWMWEKPCFSVVKCWEVLPLSCRVLFMKRMNDSPRKCGVCSPHTVRPQAVESNLKTPHVSRVPRILQAVLVALQEELEEEPAKREANESVKVQLSVTESTVWATYIDHTVQIKQPWQTRLAHFPPRHPSVVYDYGSFQCRNSSGILSKMLPCISISCCRSSP